MIIIKQLDDAIKAGVRIHGRIADGIASRFLTPGNFDDTETVLSALNAAKEEIKLHRGASRADEQRLIDAVNKAGILYMGCDTPDQLADTILELRSELAAAKEENARLTAELAL